MGLSESGHGCKNHPHHHNEKQGVCPSCLRERLSRLCSAGSFKQANSRVSPSFSPADDTSSPSSTSAAPAARNRGFHKRNGSEVQMGVMRSSTSFKVKSGKSGSMAFVPRNFDDDDDYDDDDDEEVKKGKMKKKKGFWSKLLRFKGKNNKDVLTNSTSMRLIKRGNLVS